MKIIMLGAPGAGKGTQAKMIAEKYSIPHVSTGDIFRANIKNGTELGMEAKKYMDQGLLVPDELTVKILLDRVSQDDCKNGYVLDGFPRTIPQAEVLDEALSKLGEQIDTGTVMHAAPSKELFGNIFYPKTPLHDGAVIMRDGEILAAACFLPKPSKEELINKKLGSRHRAAIGMSEVSDAIVVVVSEETGQISVAENGVLVRDYTKDKLKQHLMEQILPNPSDSWSRKPRKNPFRREKAAKGGDGK